MSLIVVGTVFLLSFALSIDDFAVGVAYGLRKKLLPFQSLAVIVLGSTLAMLASMLLGQLISGWAGSEVTKYLSALLLCGLGSRYIYEAIHYKTIDKSESELVNMSEPHHLAESFYLGAALGVDDFAEALGLSFSGFPVILTVFFFKLAEVVMILGGIYLGYYGISKHVNGRSKWIPGLILIIVGVKQLF